MKKNRYLPYGYRIRGGRLRVNDDEAYAVQTVFRLYREGASYKTIAQRMNADDYPARSDTGWNMHHIKRMLEDGRYMGENGYPAILTTAQYEAARAAHDEKFIPNAPRGTPADMLWERLRCGECGARMNHRGSLATTKGAIHLHCGN